MVTAKQIEKATLIGGFSNQCVPNSKINFKLIIKRALFDFGITGKYLIIYGVSWHFATNSLFL